MCRATAGLLVLSAATCILAAVPKSSVSTAPPLKTATVIPPITVQHYQLHHKAVKPPTSLQARKASHSQKASAIGVASTKDLPLKSAQSEDVGVVGNGTRKSRNLLKLLLMNGLDSKEHHRHHGSGSMVAHHSYNLFGKKIKAVTALSYGKPYYHSIIEVPHKHHESEEHHHHHHRPEHHHHESHESEEHHHHHHRPEHHHHESHESHESEEYHHHHHHRPEHHHHHHESSESHESEEHHHHHRPHHHESSEHYYYHHKGKPEHHRYESSENHLVRVKPDKTSDPSKVGSRPRPTLLTTNDKSDSINSYASSDYSDESYGFFNSKGDESSPHTSISESSSKRKKKKGANSNKVNNYSSGANNSKGPHNNNKSTSNRSKSTSKSGAQRLALNKVEYSPGFRRKTAEEAMKTTNKINDGYFGWMRNALKRELEQDSKEMKMISRVKGVVGEKKIRHENVFDTKKGSTDVKISGMLDKKGIKSESNVNKNKLRVEHRSLLGSNQTQAKREKEPFWRQTKDMTYIGAPINSVPPKNRLSEDAIRTLASISKLTM